MSQAQVAVLRSDVRIFRNHISHRWGFERNGRVLWLPEELDHVDFSRPEQLAEVVALIGAPLRENAFIDEVEAQAVTASDRNYVFLQALTGTYAGECAQFLDSTEFLIVGCGGLGASIAVQLAAMGGRHFVLVDGDRIDESNLNRLLFASRSDVGQQKVKVLAAHLRQRFGATATLVPEFLRHETTLPRRQRPRRFGLLTADNPKAGRTAVRLLHQQPFTPYIHAGYSGARCVVGPLVEALDCACPFCGSEELEVLSTGAPSASPSSAVNNQLTAGLVVAQVLKWSAGTTDTRVRHVLDLQSFQLNSEPARRPGCAICASDCQTAPSGSPQCH